MSLRVASIAFLGREAKARYELAVILMNIQLSQDIYPDFIGRSAMIWRLASKKWELLQSCQKADVRYWLQADISEGQNDGCLPPESGRNRQMLISAAFDPKRTHALISICLWSLPSNYLPLEWSQGKK